MNHQPEAKPTPPTLDSLIEMARDHVAKMSPEEKAEARRLQVISFAWGNVHLHNPDVTYAMVEQEYDRMFGAGR